jgi:small subunit ribosomal protein S13
MEEAEFQYIVRIAGTDVDGSKKVPVGLSEVRGIGVRTGEIICSLTGISSQKRIGTLSEEEVARLSEVVETFQDQKVPLWTFNRRNDPTTGKNLHRIGSDLAMSLREDINIMKKIKSYRGIRHDLGLPVRGQRTRTSFRRGMTVGVTRKKTAAAASAKREKVGRRKGAPPAPAKAKAEEPKPAAPAKE